MFELVERVEDYPQFLPWCGGTEVTRDDAAGVLATIQIDYRGLRQRFSTLNVSRPHESISMRLRDSRSRAWTANGASWRCAKMPARWSSCSSTRSRAGCSGAHWAPVFDQIARSFIDAFVRRAEQSIGG